MKRIRGVLVGFGVFVLGCVVWLAPARALAETQAKAKTAATHPAKAKAKKHKQQKHAQKSHAAKPGAKAWAQNKKSKKHKKHKTHAKKKTHKYKATAANTHGKPGKPKAKKPGVAKPKPVAHKPTKAPKPTPVE